MNDYEPSGRNSYILFDAYVDGNNSVIVTSISRATSTLIRERCNLSLPERKRLESSLETPMLNSSIIRDESRLFQILGPDVTKLPISESCVRSSKATRSLSHQTIAGDEWQKRWRQSVDIRRRDMEGRYHPRSGRYQSQKWPT